MINLAWILFSVVLGAIGQVILKIGANKLGEISFSPQTLVADVWAIATTPAIIIGLFFFGTSFLLWVKVLTSNELSYAYPMVSVSYVIIAVASVYLFGEPFTWPKAIGITLVVLGVVVLNS